MKKKLLQSAVFGFAVLLTAALFAMTACGGGAGGGGGSGGNAIATAFKFEDKAPPASLNRSAGRSVAGASRAIMEGTTTDAASFSSVNDFYSGLGAKVDSITPTEFSLALAGIDTVTNGQSAAFLEIGDPSQFLKVNFAENVTVVPTYPAEAGSTTTTVNIVFMSMDGTIAYGQGANAKAKVTFPISSTVAAAIKQEAEEFHAGSTAYYSMKNIYSISDTSITVTTQSLLPPDIALLFQYTGTEYKNNKFTVDTEFGTHTQHQLIIPMSTINIPADASGVTFSASMELNGIIEQYPGEDGNSNTADDVFVLANKFWERLAIGATF